VSSAALELERLAAAWRRRWALAVGAVVIGVALAGLANELSMPITLAAMSLVVALASWRRPKVDATTVATHLDRTCPSLEESTTLLLIPPGGLSAMERVQRQRAERAFQALPAPIKLPQRPILFTWGATAAFLLVAVSAWVTTASPVFPPIAGPARRAHLPPPSIERLRIRVTPPAYLGGRSTDSDGDIDAPEGSTLRFEIRTRNTDLAWIVTTDGDSLPIANERPLVRKGERSLLYQVILMRDTLRVVGGWHRVTVHPDRAPMLTVVRPEERTTLPSTGPWRVPVEILASDDHGVADARLLATITTGSGEGVRFREDTLPFSIRERRGTGLLLRTELDLAALGMGPGDELYLSAQAFDGRRPEPNEGRSATLFISIVDTAQVIEAEFDGLAIDRMPDYFRSQRQIIIDTEKLLADRPRLTEAEFRRRSNDIGIDQQLLRLRYSEVAGDESSEEGDPMSGREHAAEGGAPTPPLDPNAAAVADPNARVQADLTEGQAHSHDIAENATLLGRSTKDLLRSALSEMWQAELHLRTFRPDTALPYERRALEYLEAVRQSARSYVKRVGLEPPPLEPDRKRLTGKLDGVRNSRSDRRTTAHDTLPAVQALLAGRTDRATFEAASREIAGLAVTEPGRHLATLRDLRLVQEGITAGRPCGECALRLRAGLLAALPRPAPPADAASPTPAVASHYLDRMRRP
jgi:hypothetical protein